jgi:hypothetical protein
LMSAIIIYCIFCLHDTAYLEVISILYIWIFIKWSWEPLLQYERILICFPNIFRHFRSGQWAAENSGAWIWPHRMLVLFWPSQVCDFVLPVFKKNKSCAYEAQFFSKKRKKHNLQSRWNYHINSIHAFTTSSSIAAEFFTLQKGHLIFVGVGVLVYQFALYPYIVKYFGSIRPLRPVTVCETHLCKIRFSTPLVKMIKNLKQIKLV